LVEQNRIPSGTYRLQFSAGFTFDNAAELVDYLAHLGISHCYASPYLKARSGSTHGYDIVDHNALNPELGGRPSFERFAKALRDRGMGQVADIVPNHMGVGGNDNGWWLDVLENGPASPWAGFFDIDWNPIKDELRGKVLVPLLGAHYGEVLEEGRLELHLNPSSGDFSVSYYEHRFPVDPRTYPKILEPGLEALEDDGRVAEEDLLELRSLITAFSHLPSRFETVPSSVEERLRDKEVYKRHLAALLQRAPAVKRHVENNISRFNGAIGDPRTFDNLHALLEAQAYRLAYWQVALDEINYRRFFDINDLAGLRMEEPEVFRATHGLIIELIRKDLIQGLRIDHPDGLYAPLAYYRRLQREVQAILPEPYRPAKIDGRRACSGFYLVVEKILALYEHLEGDWPVHGTTGYSFGVSAGGLFVDSAAEKEMSRIYGRFTGCHTDFDDLLYERKKLTIEVQLSSELTVLATMLDDIAEGSRHTRDFTLNGCRDALTVLVACFPVYRTYITEKRVSEEDARYVDWAVAQAKKRSPAADISIFDFLRQVLIEGPMSPNQAFRQRATHFAMKLQQYTSPVMAKALEDTSFYIYNRLVSLNEVGGDPRRFGTTPSAFHRANQERQRNWPEAMLATSTHDAKRSEDVRARINVLSEMPGLWRKHLGRWARINQAKRSSVDGRPAPSRNDEYMLYQTLVGAWPAGSDEAAYGEFVERIKAYMLKAVKEAKVSTSWINPNADYEHAVELFVENLLNPSGQNAFLADFVPFAEMIGRYGMLNSLAQTTLKLASPGVPDFYQGTELWDLSLVDPDNRRAVDYPLRRRMLAELEERAAHEPLAQLCRELGRELPDGRAKLYLTWRGLSLRRRSPTLWREGEYLPVNAEGELEGHVCAFARERDGNAVLCAVPRLMAKAGAQTEGYPFPPNLWSGTSLVVPDELREVENVLTGVSSPQ